MDSFRFMSITTFVVSASTTSVVVVFIVIFYIFVSFKIQRYYMNLTRELTRLNAISSSPILQKLKENLEGVSSIRFYEKKKTQFGQYNQKVDDYQKNLIALKGALGWFNVRVCLLSLIVIIPTIIISVSSKIFKFSLIFLAVFCQNEGWCVWPDVELFADDHRYCERAAQIIRR